MRTFLFLVSCWWTPLMAADSAFEVLDAEACGVIAQPAFTHLPSFLPQVLQEMKGCLCGVKDGLSDALKEHVQVVTHPLESAVAFFTFLMNLEENLEEIRATWAAYEKEYPSLNQVQLRTVNCNFISHLALTGVPVVAIVKSSAKLAAKQLKRQRDVKSNHRESLARDIAQDLPFDFFVETSSHGSHHDHK